MKSTINFHKIPFFSRIHRFSLAPHRMAHINTFVRQSNILMKLRADILLLAIGFSTHISKPIFKKHVKLNRRQTTSFSFEFPFIQIENLILYHRNTEREKNEDRKIFSRFQIADWKFWTEDFIPVDYVLKHDNPWINSPKWERNIGVNCFNWNQAIHIIFHFIRLIFIKWARFTVFISHDWKKNKRIFFINSLN